MKKILILVDQLHSHGGIEKLVALKANYWAEVYGYDITIVSTEQERRPIVYDLSKKVTFRDLSINYVRTKSYFSFQNIIKFFKNIYAVQKEIFKQKPDFVLVASHIPITYVAPFLFGGAKTIKEFHFTKFSRNNSGLKNKTLTFIESKYDFLVVLSQEEKQFYFSNNTVVIANPIEHTTETFPFDYLKNENIALAIGRFAPVKRLEKMVEIWSQFNAINSSWKLFIFGAIGNEYYNTIKELVEKKGLQESIVFKGQTNSIHAELAKAKLVLMTSEQECFPMVILEANSVGIPVISFDSPTGPRNIIHHNKDGVIVEFDNDEAFVKELIKFDANEEFQLTLSKNAKENATQYEMDKIMNQWKELIFNRND